MALDLNQLRSFLIQAPRPSRILVTCGDGEQKEIAAPKGGSGTTWSGIAKSIEVLDPAKLELFNATGELLRAQGFDAMGAINGDVRPTELPEILKRDAESARLVIFAQLLADAHKFTIGVAFSKMVEIAERSDARLERVEQRLERAEAQYRREMQSKLDEAFDEVEEAAKEAEQVKENPIMGLAQSFLGGMASGSGGASPPNGKG